MNQQLKNTIDAIHRAASDHERERMQQILHDQVERVKRMERTPPDSQPPPSRFKRWFSRWWR